MAGRTQKVGQTSCTYQRLTSSKALVIGMSAKGPEREKRPRKRIGCTSLPFTIFQRT